LGSGEVRVRFVSGLAGEVGLGWAVVEHPPVDVVQDAVELAIPKALSRWRVILPEDASKGPTPARAEKAASERNRPGWDPGDQQLGGAHRADAGLAGQGGHDLGDELAQLGLVGA